MTFKKMSMIMIQYFNNIKIMSNVLLMKKKVQKYMKFFYHAVCLSN